MTNVRIQNDAALGCTDHDGYYRRELRNPPVTGSRRFFRTILSIRTELLFKPVLGPSPADKRRSEGATLLP